MDAVFFENILVPQDPIFLVGFPRSGTTLLQALMCTQHGIISFPETHFFSIILNRIKSDPNEHIYLENIENVFREIGELMDINFPKKFIDDFLGYAKKKKITAKNLFELIIFQYIFKKKYVSSHRWLEKTPDHVFHMETILNYYPKSQFIAIIRHPLYSINSFKKMPWGKDISLKSLSLTWLKAIDSIEWFQRKYNSKIYTLRYEDLVSDVEREMERICTFLSVDYESKYLSNFSLEAESIVLKNEIWKDEVRCNKIMNKNVCYKQNHLKGYRIIQHYCYNKMLQYGYALSPV